MTKVDEVAEGVENMNIEEQEEEKKPHEPFSLPILEVIKTMQAANGLRHNDHHRYRQYCTRRLRRIRRALDHTFGKGKFKPNPLPNEFDDAKFLTIPLVQAERAWSFGTQLKLDSANASVQNARFRLHSVARFTKAAAWATKLREMCEKHCDARSVMEAEAYESFLTGTMLVERESWEAAKDTLDRCLKLYENLSMASAGDKTAIYKAMMRDLEQPIRLCNYSTGGHGAQKEKDTQGGAGGAKGGKLSYRNTSLDEPEETNKGLRKQFREAMARVAQEDNAAGANARFGELGNMLADVLKNIHDAMIQDPNNPDWRNVECFVREHMICNNVERVVNTISTLFDTLASDKVVDLASAESRRNCRPEEGLRLCDDVKGELTLLAEMPEEDAVEGVLETYLEVIANARCLVLALCYVIATKYEEAVVLLEHLDGRVSSVRFSKPLDAYKRLDALMQSFNSKIPNLVASWHARAMVLLAGREIEDGDVFEDNLGIGSFPPSIEPIACKPLLMDLAFNQLEIPNFDGTGGHKSPKGAHSKAESPKAGVMGKLAGWASWARG